MNLEQMKQDPMGSDARATFIDACEVYYVSFSPEFWERANALPLSGIDLRCYGYIVGTCKLYAATSEPINFRNMAKTLYLSYESVMRSVRKLKKFQFVVQHNKDRGNVFFIPDVQGIMDAAHERNMLKLARHLEQQIEKAVEKAQRLPKWRGHPMPNHEKMKVALGILNDRSDRDIQKVLPYLKFPFETEEEKFDVAALLADFRAKFGETDMPF